MSNQHKSKTDKAAGDIFYHSYIKAQEKSTIQEAAYAYFEKARQHIVKMEHVHKKILRLNNQGLGQTPNLVYPRYIAQVGHNYLIACNLMHGQFIPDEITLAAKTKFTNIIDGCQMNLLEAERNYYGEVLDHMKATYTQSINRTTIADYLTTQSNCGDVSRIAHETTHLIIVITKFLERSLESTPMVEEDNPMVTEEPANEKLLNLVKSLTMELADLRTTVRKNEQSRSNLQQQSKQLKQTKLTRPSTTPPRVVNITDAPTPQFAKNYKARSQQKRPAESDSEKSCHSEGSTNSKPKQPLKKANSSSSRQE